jgi:hypothetical protein
MVTKLAKERLHGGGSRLHVRGRKMTKFSAANENGRKNFVIFGRERDFRHFCGSSLDFN